MSLTALARTVLQLRKHGVPHGLFGAIGLARYGIQRGTADVDLLATAAALEPAVWRDVRSIQVDRRLGDDDDNLVGCVKIGPRAAYPVDVVVPRGRWPARALDRVVETVEIDGLSVPILTLEDIVLSKVHSAGPGDVHDLTAICKAFPDRVPAIVAHVDAEQAHLYGPARRDWPRIRGMLRGRS